MSRRNSHGSILSAEILAEQNEYPENEKHPIFTEMAELDSDGQSTTKWKQVARWVKYEENVEKGGQRWSKPFVPTITLKSLKNLRFLLEHGSLEMYLANQTLGGIWEFIVDRWIKDNLIDESKREQFLRILLCHHAHLYQGNTTSSTGNFLSVPNASRGDEVLYTISPSMEAPQRTRKLTRLENGEDVRNKLGADLQSEVRQRKVSQVNLKKTNNNFFKKVPNGSQAFIVHIAEVPCLATSISAFVRLTNDGVMLGNLTEIPIPTKFIFVLLGPKGTENQLRQTGRALPILMLNSEFKELAYTVKTREELLEGVDSYMDSTTVLPPPGGWNPDTRIEPHAIPDTKSHDNDHSENAPSESGLIRTGKLFGGLVNDVKRKLPFYYSDFRDALSLQCVATWLFLYFACLTPLITFGGLLGEKTDNYMGTMETLLAGCIAGIFFALFAGQPLLILGATGPMLAFEGILAQFTNGMELNYLELRLWVGIWIAVILFVVVAFDLSTFVRYITKFTEENFATLIAMIFMVEAIRNLSEINEIEVKTSESNQADSLRLLQEEGKRPTNIFLMSILLFIGTFLTAFLINEFRNTPFLSVKIRTMISNFAVIIAIIIMSGVDKLVGLGTPKLTVPSDFHPTIPDRGWIISPFNRNPAWVIIAAIAPALLATILIFMDQQITAVIINRKDHKLKKGGGYHLDLTVLAVLILINSFLGLPWFVAATVESVTNVGSLKLETESAAPGERPLFLGVREQRVTNLVVFITVGLSIFMSPVLEIVPMPVLYGVFLYMGFSALRKMELVERILLLCMPTKYQPDNVYLRQVPIRRVHLYTLIQVVCLALLWVIKSIPETAIFFPVMLVLMMGVRKLLERVFDPRELSALDELLPNAKKTEKEELI